MYKLIALFSLTLLLACSSVLETPCHCRIQHLDDLDQAKLCAKKCDRPLLILFTGWAVSNASSLALSDADDIIKETLKENYVTVELYVDNDKKLPYVEKAILNGKERTIGTVGQHYSYIQNKEYNTNTQPFYVILSADGKTVLNQFGYQPYPTKFNETLLEALKMHRNSAL